MNLLQRQSPRLLFALMCAFWLLGSSSAQQLQPPPDNLRFTVEWLGSSMSPTVSRPVVVKCLLENGGQQAAQVPELNLLSPAWKIYVEELKAGNEWAKCASYNMTSWAGLRGYRLGSSPQRFQLLRPGGSILFYVDLAQCGYRSKPGTFRLRGEFSLSNDKELEYETRPIVVVMRENISNRANVLQTAIEQVVTVTQSNMQDQMQWICTFGDFWLDFADKEEPMLACLESAIPKFQSADVVVMGIATMYHLDPTVERSSALCDKLQRMGHLAQSTKDFCALYVYNKTQRPRSHRGQVRLPRPRSLAATQAGGYIFRFRDGSMQVSPHDDRGNMPDSLEDWIESIRRERTGDVMFSRLKKGSLAVFSGRVTDLGVGEIADFADKDIQKPTMLGSSGGGPNDMPNVLPPATIAAIVGNVYLVETVDKRYALLRVVDKSMDGIVIDWVYQIDGTTKFSRAPQR